MDHSSLLYQIGRLPTDRQPAKLAALKFAWQKVVKVAPDLTFENFVVSIPTLILNTQFGRPAEDAYYTALLAAGSYFQTDLDPIFACVLNRITLELNFQTRFLGTGRHAEALVLDCAKNLYPFVMANGNVVAGVQVAAEAEALPHWANELEHFDYQLHNLFSSPVEGLADLLKAKNREVIGCLAFTLPFGSDDAFDVMARYAHISSFIHPETYQVVRAPLSIGLEFMAAVENKYENARIVSKAYTAAGDAEPNLIVIVTGVSGVVDVRIAQKVRVDCTIESMHQLGKDSKQNFSMVRHHRDQNGNETELVLIKPPLVIETAAPLPLECRNRISQSQPFPHLTYVMKNGKMAAIEGFQFSSHIHFDSENVLIRELSEHSGLEFTSVYRNSLVDDAGVRRSSVTFDSKIKVDGPVMPLTFTPSLHTYHSHFLLQCFPRVLIFRDLMPDGKLIVPPTLRKKQLEMLKMVGIDESHMIIMPPNVLVEADELYVPHPWPLVFSPYTLQIYDEIARQIPNASPVAKRALISREQRTTWRNMLTYEQVKNMLVDNYGFEVIRPEKLTLAEEINLYRNVDIMIVAEGAGLYSAVFSKPEATYISIGDEDYIMPVIGSIASVRDFEVGYVFGDSLRSDFDVSRRKPYGHSDFVVDPASVARIVDAVLSVRNV